ncbi:hypothetical protein ONZ45_g6153 [Pleurotus djamor]|nr:hypothetical protein ONZ45_g6153 [Pleurotus djamor]
MNFVHWQPDGGKKKSNRGSQVNANGGSSAQVSVEHRDSHRIGGSSGNVDSVASSSSPAHSLPSTTTFSLPADASSTVALSGGQRDLGTSFSTSSSSSKPNAKKKVASSSSGKSTASSSRINKRPRDDDEEDAPRESEIAGTSEAVQYKPPIRGRPRKNPTTTNPSAKRRKGKATADPAQPEGEASVLATTQVASSSSIVAPPRRGTRSGPRAENPYPVIPSSLIPTPSQPEAVAEGSSPSTTEVASTPSTADAPPRRRAVQRAEIPYPVIPAVLPTTNSRPADSGSTTLSCAPPAAPSDTDTSTAGADISGEEVAALYPSPQLANVPVVSRAAAVAISQTQLPPRQVTMPSVDDTNSSGLGAHPQASSSSTSADSNLPFAAPVGLSWLPLGGLPIFAPMPVTPMIPEMYPAMSLDAMYPLPHRLKVQRQRQRFERPRLSFPIASPDPVITSTAGPASPVAGNPPTYAAYPPHGTQNAEIVAPSDGTHRRTLETIQPVISGNYPASARENIDNDGVTASTSQLALPIASQENSRPMTNAIVARQGTQSQVPTPIVSNPQHSENSFGVAHHEHHNPDDLQK